MHRASFVAAALIVVLVGCHSSSSRQGQPISGPTIEARRAAVVSVSRDASEVGRDVMMRGGNAVDAAVATAFALAVTFPEAGNIGGGGFMLIRTADGKTVEMIDYRETAPAAATVDMFAKGIGSEHRLVGVPGTVRGLALAHERHGRLPWGDLVQPAGRLAREGFILNADSARSLNRAIARPGDEADEMRRVLGKPGGGNWSAGDRLVQSQLAETLQKFATGGPDAFYEGPVAQALVDTVKSGGGIITTSDLAAYQAKVRQPIRGSFRGYDIYAPPPPSSGGITLVLMLNVLEHLDLRARGGRWEPQTLHLMIETMRRGFADRARHLGDPDFVSIPPHLTTKEYAAKVAATIDPNRATPSESIAGDIKISDESHETTHFSVLDAQGMAVSNTYTLEKGYGGRVMVKGMGFLLNDEMGDFNPKPGVTDRRGRIGTTPNQVAPGKRMLSSMTPVIVTKGGRLVMITGSPGGRKIINTVLCVLINALEYDMSPREAIDAPRFTHTWLPDELSIEAGLAKDHAESIAALKKLGHAIKDPPSKQGDAHSIFVDEKGTIRGVADHRRSGSAAGF